VENQKGTTPGGDYVSNLGDQQSKGGDCTGGFECLGHYSEAKKRGECEQGETTTNGRRTIRPAPSCKWSGWGEKGRSHIKNHMGGASRKKITEKAGKKILLLLAYNGG